MKISKKTDYALRALFTLAAHTDRSPLSIRDLAQRNDIPRRFLVNIMLELRDLGWVRSVSGRDGGYVLSADPAQLTIGAVVRHFDGVLAPIGCVSVTCYEPCSQEPVCRFRRVLLEARNYTARLIDGATIAATLAGKPVTRQEVFEEELIGGLGI